MMEVYKKRKKINVYNEEKKGNSSSGDAWHSWVSLDLSQETETQTDDFKNRVYYFSMTLSLKLSFHTLI